MMELILFLTYQGERNKRKKLEMKRKKGGKGKGKELVRVGGG